MARDYSGKKYIGSLDDYGVCSLVIQGVCIDENVSFRHGAKDAPDKIRESSLSIEEYSIREDKTLEDLNYFDSGNITNYQEIFSTTTNHLQAGKKLVSIGGDHSVSWPIMDAYSNQYDDLIIIHFDAHADMRDELDGNDFSHATPINKITKKIGGSNVFSYGIRSGCKEELDWAKEQGVRINFNSVLEGLRKDQELLKGKRVYLTIDIDVLDPAYAPGTGTPEAMGISVEELLNSVKEVATNCNVVGLDLVEISPDNDHGDVTSILGSKLLREMLLMIGDK